MPPPRHWPLRLMQVEHKEIRRNADHSLGMSIKTRDGTCGQLTVHSVQPFGPAQLGGLRRGHVIVAVDGKDILGYSHQRAIELLATLADRQVLPLTVCLSSVFLKHQRNVAAEAATAKTAAAASEARPRSTADARPKSAASHRPKSAVRKLEYSPMKSCEVAAPTLTSPQPGDPKLLTRASETPVDDEGGGGKPTVDAMLNFLVSLRDNSGLTARGAQMLAESAFAQHLDDLESDPLTAMAKALVPLTQLVTSPVRSEGPSPRPKGEESTSRLSPQVDLPSPPPPPPPRSQTPLGPDGKPVGPSLRDMVLGKLEKVRAEAQKKRSAKTSPAKKKSSSSSITSSPPRRRSVSQQSHASGSRLSNMTTASSRQKIVAPRDRAVINAPAAPRYAPYSEQRRRPASRTAALGSQPRSGRLEKKSGAPVGSELSAGPAAAWKFGGAATVDGGNTKAGSGVDFSFVNLARLESDELAYSGGHNVDTVSVRSYATDTWEINSFTESFRSRATSYV
mmetsp:Transcript_1024/g.3457  ORF Transcript_1024/g.3457 Transcript_1024/m.3457 type:complete len:508 (+) Transcript_1024:674-2197(+)